MSARSPAPSIYNLWLATAEAHVASWTTLSVRVPMLMSGTITQPERTRMVTEKMEAAAESACDASFAFGSMMLKNPLTLFDPAASFHSALTILSAASNPFHRRVKANAKRLNGRAR